MLALLAVRFPILKKLMKDRDCLQLAGKRAVKEKLATRAQLNKIDKEIAALMATSVKEALAAPGPSTAELLTDVYASAY